jgi:hypothetical protein
MAENPNFRSYRSNIPLGSGESAPTQGSRPASDPLAELARLIGQNDPFADLRREASHGEAARPPAASTDWQTPRPGPAYREAYQAPLAPQHVEPHQFENPPHTDPHGHAQPAYDPLYGKAPEDAHGHDAETYDDRPAAMAQGDEGELGEQGYDDIPEPRARRGLKAVMVLTGLVILGAGGAFAYRSMFGPGGTPVPPPVIKADTTPSKVVPAQSGEPANKLIYDRVGEASQGEKVVSREEQPVEIRDASRSAPPRAVFPEAPSAPPGAAASMASAPPASPNTTEPKKVRTLTIRPDQPMPASPAAARPIPSVPRNASGIVAAQAATGAGFPPANARPVAPKVVTAAPTAVPPAPSGNAPLSLNPQSSDATSATSAPQARPRPAPAPARVASAAAGGSEAGSYIVQLSSQRSEADAQASFRSLQSKFPNLLSARQPIIRRADLGDKGIYFRAMVGPFASAEEAGGFCGSLKTAGGQCVVQRN